MPAISKYSSMVYRLSQIYFDEQLAPYHIGCGQQFFYYISIVIRGLINMSLHIKIIMIKERRPEQ